MSQPRLRPQAVLFDMDGLMFDTETLYMRSAQRACIELGQTLTETFYRTKCVGRRVVDIEQALRAEFGADFPLDTWEKRTEHLLDQALRAGPPVKPGLDDLLTRLETLGIPKGVATSTRRETALITLGAYAARFDAITTGDEITHGKPAPDIFLLAASRLGIATADGLVLEDSSAGVRAAYAAGIPVIWVPDMQTPTAEVSALALHVLTSLYEVAALLPAGTA
jgi:HAD superfamily hydrolase (TIGR01509 family)